MEHLIEKLTTTQGIVLNPPASATDIHAFEKAIGTPLPTELKKFYTICNGFENIHDHLFRLILLSEILQEKHDFPAHQFPFAEYMIYSDVWHIELSSANADKYTAMNGNHSMKPVVLTHSIIEFLHRYVDGGGIFGEQGLYQWYEEQLG